MIDNTFWNQIVITLGAIITTYITTKHGPKLTNYLRGTSNNPPSEERYNTMFDGYERTLKWYEEQNQLKEQKISKLEQVVNQLQVDLDTSRKIIAELKEDNAAKQKEVKKLQHAIVSMRKKFDSTWENGAA